MLLFSLRRSLLLRKCEFGEFCEFFPVPNEIGKEKSIRAEINSPNSRNSQCSGWAAMKPGSAFCRFSCSYRLCHRAAIYPSLLEKIRIREISIIYSSIYVCGTSTGQTRTTN
jgi:hypothetical protein